MADDLLPCPFCGGKARLIDGTVNHVGHFIRCDYCMFDYPGGKPNSEINAVAMWNMRQERKPLP